MPHNISPHPLTKSPPIREINHPTENTKNPEELLCIYYKNCITNIQQLHCPPEPYTLLVDTTATHYYLQTEAIPHCVDILPALGPIITVANGGIIFPQQQATVPLLSTLSQSVQHSYVFDDLKNRVTYISGPAVHRNLDKVHA